MEIFTLLFIFFTKSQAILSDSQSHLSSPAPTLESQPEYDTQSFLVTKTTSYPSSSNASDIFQLLSFLNSKIVILEIPSSSKYSFPQSPILSNTLKNFCESSQTTSNILLIYQTLKTQLEDFSLLLIVNSDFSANPENFDIKEEDLGIQNFTDVQVSDMVFAREIFMFLEKLQSLVRVVKTSMLKSLIFQRPWLTSTTKSLQALLGSTLNSFTEKFSNQEEYFYFSLFSEYTLILTTFFMTQNSFPCSESSVEFVENPAQQLANSIQELRISYPDQSGEIVLNSANIKQEIFYYEDLISSLSPTDFVFIGDILIDLYRATDDLQILQKTLQKLEKENNVLIFTDGQTSFTEASVTNSEALSTNAYEKIVEVFLNFTEDIPIVATGNSSKVIAAQGTKQILVKNLNESLTNGSVSINRVFEGEFLILTSLFCEKEGTGKVWVMPLEDPNEIYLLLEGFRAPVNVCFDPIHLFLYVIDKRVDPNQGKIFQYKLRIKKKLELDNKFYTEVYSGSPVDCKVDFYGNLYFTDNKMNSINIISFADLFSGFKNAYFAIYSYSKDNMRINKPESFVFSTSNLIFFVNGANEAGSINYASSEVESLNELDIGMLVNTPAKVQAIAYGQNKVFYATEGGGIFVYNLYTKSDDTLSEGFFIDPQGLCFSNNNLYISDHGKGAVFLLDLFTNSIQMIASVQAVNGLFCLSSSLSSFLLSCILYVI